jgi:hypothetical protein
MTEPNNNNSEFQRIPLTIIHAPKIEDDYSIGFCKYEGRGHYEEIDPGWLAYSIDTRFNSMFDVQPIATIGDANKNRKNSKGGILVASFLNSSEIVDAVGDLAPDALIVVDPIEAPDEIELHLAKIRAIGYLSRLDMPGSIDNGWTELIHSRKSLGLPHASDSYGVVVNTQFDQVMVGPEHAFKGLSRVLTGIINFRNLDDAYEE